MKEIFESLHPKAQEELVRDHVIELVTVAATAIPDPARPDDRSAMVVVAETGHEFREDIPWIEAELARIITVCCSAENDLSPGVRADLLADLNKRRDELNGIHKEMIAGTLYPPSSDPRIQELFRPENYVWDPEITVWCHCWTVAMDDDGKLVIDTEDPFLYEKVDDPSRSNIYERVRGVNGVIGGIVGRMRG